MSATTFAAILFQPIALSLSFLLIYYLRSNGFPAVCLAVLAAFAGLFFKEIRKTFINYFLSVLFIFSVSYPFANRGPSLGNFLFLISFAPLLVVLSEKGKNQTSKLILCWLPVFTSWLFASNWEFPSTFSPIVVYGEREIGFIAAAFFLAAILAPYKRKKLLLSVISLPMLVLSSSFILNDLKDVNSFFQTISWVNFFSAAILAIFLIYFFLNEQLLRPVGAGGELAASLILTAPLLTLYGLLGHLWQSLLPLPFDLTKILAASTFAVCGYLLLRLNPLLSIKRSSMFFVIPAFLRLFLPAEANFFYYHEQRYFYYSSGWEHFGPWFFAWLLLVVISLEADIPFIYFLIFLMGVFSLPLYFSRLFHFVGIAPIEFFKDLGSEGVSWVRVPILKSEPYLLLGVLGIILLVYLLRKSKGL